MKLPSTVAVGGCNMAVYLQRVFLSPSSTLTARPTFKKTEGNQSVKIPEVSQKPTSIPPLKQIPKQGSLKEAFVALNIFRDQNPPHNCLNEAYSLVLELCASKKALSQCQQIHALVLKSNVACDLVFLDTKLVYIYGKCGCLLDAETVFDDMSVRTVFTWNAMLGAYLTNGQPFLALQLYEDMRVLGVPLDACTFSCILKACAELKDLDSGIEIHGHAVKLGFVSNVFVANALVGMYAKCNDLDGAMLVFERMFDGRDVISWNSIIFANAANGQYAVALNLLREMQKVGVSPSTYTFVAALQACKEAAFGRLGMEIHAAVVKSTQYLDIYVANALIDMYARCGKMDEATTIFNMMDEKDTVSWNSMLSGLVQNGLFIEAMLLFHEMQTAGQKPDLCSIVSIAAASGRLKNLLNGMEVHSYAIRHGLESNLQVANTLVDMYARCGRTNYMKVVFDKLPSIDTISWVTIIAGYVQNHYHLKALELFREFQWQGVDADAMMIQIILQACGMLKCVSLVKEIHGFTLRRRLSDLPLQNFLVEVYGECGKIAYAFRSFEMIELKNVVSWTSMISCYVQIGLANEALELFLKMNEAGIEPDSVALIIALSAVADLSSLRKGEEIHGFLLRKGIDLGCSLASSLVDMYACCGTVENSYKVFNCVKDNDLILWTSMINAFGMHGNAKEAIKLFRKMEHENIIPDHITFLALLYACSHAALVDEGKRLFERMKREYNLEPWPEHYTCMMDLLGRANHLDEAFQFLNTMQMEPSAAVWRALLSACQLHTNKELGELAAQKLLELDTPNSENYVLISNMFAARGQWKEVEEVRRTMKGKGLTKVPACSWIEVGSKAHVFIARDKSHPLSDVIYEKLAQVTKQLKREGGYEPQTKYVLHNIAEEEKLKMLFGHSERLAIAYGLLSVPEGNPIRVTKNLRVCGDCHTFSKLVSKYFEREIIMRDSNRFYHFRGGTCSCGDLW